MEYQQSAEKLACWHFGLDLKGFGWLFESHKMRFFLICKAFTGLWTRILLKLELDAWFAAFATLSMSDQWVAKYNVGGWWIISWTKPCLTKGRSGGRDCRDPRLVSSTTAKVSTVTYFLKVLMDRIALGFRVLRVLLYKLSPSLSASLNAEMLGALRQCHLGSCNTNKTRTSCNPHFNHMSFDVTCPLTTYEICR